MNRTHLFAAVTTATLLALAGCGGGGSSGGSSKGETPAPAVSVAELSAGAYIVSLGSADDLSIGKYYADASGSRLLVVTDDDDRADALYRRQNSGSKWIAVPGPGADVTISFLQSTPIVVDAVDVADVAGSYQTRLPSGAAADFAIAANGDITAGSSSCKLSGKVEGGTLPGTLKLTLDAASCGSLPAKTTGVLIVDRDYAPAAFRLVGDDEKTVVDLWGYAN